MAPDRRDGRRHRGASCVGFGLLLVLVAPQHLSLGGQTFGIGLGITAYTLGMRHAFDVDHIAAIDNTTRKLMDESRDRCRSGSGSRLGHSTIVFAMCVAARASASVRSLSQVERRQLDSSRCHRHRRRQRCPARSSSCSASINLFILVGIVKIFRRMRSEAYDEQTLEDLLSIAAFINRILRRVMVAVRKPWHMYPVGVLFGFGFDTATRSPCSCWPAPARHSSCLGMRPLPADPVHGRHVPVRHNRTGRS